MQDADHVDAFFVDGEGDDMAADGVATVSEADLVDPTPAIRLLRDPFDGALDLEQGGLGLAFVPSLDRVFPDRRP
jgi:hypothetical protein